MNDRSTFHLAILWATLLAVVISMRPLLPIDETRYLTVAWEMWRDDSFLVPHLNGELYSHKPPLLFWLMQLGWSIFGVVEWWARMVAPLFGIGSLILTAKLARMLWPERPQVATLAPVILFSGLYWLVFSTMTMFDMLVTFFTLVGMIGLVTAWQGKMLKGFILVAIAIGLGVLSKGPVILLHVLPYWGPRFGPAPTSWAKWYGAIVLAILGGAGIALTWAIPAAIAGGPVYADAIFWGQSAGRMVKSFAHQRPVYWVLALLPLMVLPWTVWPSLWRALLGRTGITAREAIRLDGGARMVKVWFLFAFVAFSLISGKQPHYLLPEFPALALLLAFALVVAAERLKERVHPSFDSELPILVLSGLSLLIGVTLVMLPDMAAYMKVPTWAAHTKPWPAILAGLVGGAFYLYARKRPLASLSDRATLISGYAFVVIAFLHMSAQATLGVAYNVETAALKVKAYQDAGRPVAHYGKYHGQFQFLGRLEQPIAAPGVKDALITWMTANPNGVVITNQRTVPDGPTSLYSQPYRGKIMAMWNAQDLLSHPDAAQR